MKSFKKSLGVFVFLFLSFILWTVAISFIDLGSIGPNGSSVGFATLNGWFHSVTGVHMTLYLITDWAGLVPVAVGFGFAVLGLVQWIKRKNILKVDFNILTLGGFYILVLAFYLLFEEFVVNYRPILINGYLEASYPSSTTLLVFCIMPTAILQLKARIKRQTLKKVLNIIIVVFTVFMVVGRLISGVHWLTDIIGGILLSGSLVTLYYSINKKPTV
ncbi:MAG: phosphatase PAP2 family protein [Clostridia bacterium]|nr:phosphatase PAP2 family protein [Clostridia bacterium]